MSDPLSPVVKQSNELVSLAVERWPIHEKRVMLALAAAMRDDDPIDAEYRMDARELIVSMGGTRSEYSKIYTAAESLLSRQVFTTETLSDGRRHFIGINLFSKIEYTEGTATITAQPSQAARAFFVGLQKYFTLLPLDEVLSLTTFPAVRLFELLMQFRATGWRQISVEEIRPLLGLVELEPAKQGRKEMKVKRVKYPTSGQLLKHVLRPCAVEITEKTSLKIDEIRQVRRGKKILAFRFCFHLEESSPLPLWPGRRVRHDSSPGPLFKQAKPTKQAAAVKLPDVTGAHKKSEAESAALLADRQRIRDTLAALDEETRNYILRKADQKLQADGNPLFISQPQREALAVEILEAESL